MEGGSASSFVLVSLPASSCSFNSRSLLRWKRDRHGDDNGPLPLFNGLGLLVVNEGFTFDTLKLMDAAREVRVAAHSRATIRPIREVVEHAWLLPGLGIGIQDGRDIAL